MNREFEDCFSVAVNVACSDWGYATPGPEFFERVYKRLPEGLRTTLSWGIKEEIITIKGNAFYLKGLPSGKGPYSLLAKDRSNIPAANWEYFVQAAEYARLYPIAQRSGMILSFEDQLMDLTLRQGESLLVCGEVKETAEQVYDLVGRLFNYENILSLPQDQKDGDPLQKAKYIQRHRPLYFYCIGIGAKQEFKVTYPEGKQFQLTRDIIPYIYIP